MTYAPSIHHRRSIRLPGHDYARPGLYFVTLCTADRRPLFGTVVNGRMALNDAGRVVREEWQRSAAIRSEIELDEWIVMPDHFHAIARIRKAGDPPVAPTIRATGAAPRSLGALIAGFKSASGRRINDLRQTPGVPVWHRDYYDIIIRDAAALANIRAYIRFNPQNYQAVMAGGEPKFLGDRGLLARPKLGFLASRGAVSPHGELALRAGEAILSGFLSPMERKVFEAGLTHKTPLIWVKPWALEESTDTPVLREAVAKGRLLILSPFEAGITTPSARRAVWCNEYVLAHSQRVIVGHLNPDGMLACILSEADPGKELVFL